MRPAPDPALARKAAADLLYAVLLEEGLDRGPTEREVDRLLAAAPGHADPAALRAAAVRIVAPAAAAERPRAAGICTLGEGARFGRLRR